MNLIIGKNDVKASFMANWTSRFVPAILLYERSTRVSIIKIGKNVDEAGIYRYFCL